MARWTWNGGANNRDTPNTWIGPEDSNDNFPVGNPAPDDTASIENRLVIDELALTDLTVAGYNFESTIDGNTTFAQGNTATITTVANPGTNNVAACDYHLLGIPNLVRYNTIRLLDTGLVANNTNMRRIPS